MQTLTIEETLAEIIKNSLQTKGEYQKVIGSIQPDTSKQLKTKPFTREHEAPNSCLVMIRPNHTRNMTYLLVSSYPKICVHRILVSTAFKSKSIETLRRLRFNNNQMIRAAAELELSIRLTENYNE